MIHFKFVQDPREEIAFADMAFFSGAALKGACKTAGNCKGALAPEEGGQKDHVLSAAGVSGNPHPGPVDPRIGTEGIKKRHGFQTHKSAHGRTAGKRAEVITVAELFPRPATQYVKRQKSHAVGT